MSGQPCPECGTEIAPRLLCCPLCKRLVHQQELGQLATRAREATASGDEVGALAAWRRALELLPAESRQATRVAERVAQLSRRVDGASSRSLLTGNGDGSRGRRSGWLKGLGLLGGSALLLWKFKALVPFLLTKGKLLALGLTKASTLLSMFASFGLYWSLWGWTFALGLVASIYVHEMGHVAALQRFGIRASAPTFIPGLGALVRLRQYPANAIEDARVGLAGPIWGLATAIAFAAIYLATGQEIWGAIARVGAWINLFNLLPIAPLDGGRGFRAMSRAHRWLAVAVLALMWMMTEEGLLVLLVLVAAARALGRSVAGQEGDRRAALEYVTLVVVLSGLAAMPVAVSL